MNVEAVKGKIKDIAFVVIVIIVIIGAWLALSEWVSVDADGAYVEAGQVWTRKQEILRSMGYADDDEAIKALSAAWWKEQADLDVVAKVVWGEARGCPWEHKVAVAAVVMNRVHSDLFPNSVREVVGQPMQYTTIYLSNFGMVTRDCYEAAKVAMDGEDNVPDDVIWQAEFRQGKETWWVSYVDTGWYSSTTYFCR